MATIKAGTYKFNDVLTYDANKISDYWLLEPFEVNALLSMGGQSQQVVMTCGYQLTLNDSGNVIFQYIIGSISPKWVEEYIPTSNWYKVYKDGVWANQFYANVEDTKSITFLNDIELDGLNGRTETNLQFLMTNTNYNEVNGITPEEPTLIRKFTRLYLGDIVASTATRRLRKLTTEKPQDDIDSMLGVWVLDNTITPANLDSVFDFSFNYGDGYNTHIRRGSGITVRENSAMKYNKDYAGYETTAYRFTADETNPIGWQNESYKTVTVIQEPRGAADTDTNTFKEWWKAHANRVINVEDIDITGTWIFNSNINFEIVYASSSKFEINGLDYTCNGINYNSMYFKHDNSTHTMYYSYDDIPAYSNTNGWVSDELKTITINSNPTGSEKMRMYVFLNSCATKQ